MRLIVIILMFSISSLCEAETAYKLYENESLGVSFKYPSWVEVEDISQDGKTKIWFHVGEWPKGLKHIGKENLKSPISGVLFSVKMIGNFEVFVNKERAGQVKGGYRNEITEKKHTIGKSVIGIEFVRENKPIEKIMHYLIFPSLRKNAVLSLWHIQDTSTGFMGYPEEEERAVIEYQRIIKTLKVYK